MKKKYKIISIFSILFVILSMAFIILDKNNLDRNKSYSIDKEYALGEAFFPGDVNGNNKLDVKDYKYIVRYIVGVMNFNDNQKRAADINGDGNVTPKDYKMVVRKIIAGETGDSTPPLAASQAACYYKDADPWQYVWTSNPPSGYVKENVSKSDCVNVCYCKDGTNTCGVYAKGKSWAGWSYYSDTSNPNECKKESSAMESLANDSRFNGYSVVASCESSTMKYAIGKKNGEYYTLIWVANPVSQFGVALANGAKGTASASTILSSALYSRTCAVAVNGSLFENSTIVGGVIINHGVIIKNTGKAEGLIGMNYNGYLGEYSHRTAEDILSSGVVNTVGMSSPAYIDDKPTDRARTQICQIGLNYFALFSGGGTVSEAGSKLSSFAGCGTVYNLDGGGSRTLYYQTKSSGLTNLFVGRNIFDMVYFSE